MRKRLLLLCILCIMSVFAACSPKETEKGKKLNVVTTIFAPYDFVREIAGDNVNLTMLLAPGEESHSFDPSPQDIIDIYECDLFIYNGGENDKWVDDMLDSADSDIEVVKMMDCVDILYEEEDHDGNRHYENRHDKEQEPDEHVWTSPLNAAKISSVIADRLAELDSDNKALYYSNCDKYTDKLIKLYDDITEVVKSAKRNEVVFGDRFALRYFTEAFGIKYYAAFPGCAQDTEINPSEIVSVIDLVRDKNIPVIFKAELGNGQIADTISEATGAEVRTFYSCHNVSLDDFNKGIGYIDMMNSNLELLREALN